MGSRSSTPHFCHVCHQLLRIRAGDPMVCPTCGGGFIEEITGLHDRTTPLEGNFVGTLLNWINNRRNNEGHNPAHDGMLNGPFLILRRSPNGDNVAHMQLIFTNEPGGEPRPLTANLGDNFMATALQQIIEQLTQTGISGPPPATGASVDAMPKITINSRHLVNNSHCPVCKERFELGGEAREMPCSHIYHSDCIVPWLAQHNSCPVCRQGLPSGVPETAEVGSSSSGNNSASSPTGPPVPGGQGEAPVFSVTMEPLGQNDSYWNPPVFIEGGRNSNASTRNISIIRDHNPPVIIEGGRNSNASTRNSSIIRDHITAGQAPNSRNDHHRCNLISYLLRFWPSSANPPSNSQRDRNASHSNDNVNRRRVGRD